MTTIYKATIAKYMGVLPAVSAVEIKRPLEFRTPFQDRQAPPFAELYIHGEGATVQPAMRLGTVLMRYEDAKKVAEWILSLEQHEE